MVKIKWEGAYLKNPSDNGGSNTKRSSSLIDSEPEKRQEKGGRKQMSRRRRKDGIGSMARGEKLNDGEGNEGMEGYYCIQETWRCIEMRLRSWASTTECSKRIT